MAGIADVVREEVSKYVGTGLNIKIFPIFDEVHQIYAVNTISYPERHRPAGVMLLARVIGDKVIIEEDRTDRPLVDALMQAGLPREQIILAYAGEPVPEEA